VRFRYVEWDDRLHGRLRLEDLLKLWNALLLRLGGNVDQALRWMEKLGERYGLFDENLTFDEFRKILEREGLVRQGPSGLEMTRKGERYIRQDSLAQIFGNLKRDQAGDHRVPHAGSGGERLTETRPFRFGDQPSDIDPTTTLGNAIRRGGIDDISLTEDDFAVFENEHLSAAATVLLIDVSHSMVLYGEDRFTPAKKVALALTELILRRFKKDTLHVVLFGDEAREVQVKDLPYVEVGPYYTNTRAGLQMAREILRREKPVNKQIFMITDGKPSALTEGGRIYRNPIGLDRRIINKTLEEAALCRRKHITITTFMIASDPYLMEFVEELTRVNHGRAYFADPEKVGSFLLVDFIRNRKRRVR